ncbi:MAG: DUF1343 domain-containing protein [bacterium]
MIRFTALLLFTLIISVNCKQNYNSKPINKVICGADILISDSLNLIKGKGIGIVTNHTAVLSNGTHLVDLLFNIDDINIVALFGPEHGIRGDAPDGLTITDGKDSKTGIPVYSLYGKIRKPTKEMLKGVDVLIFDIQDIGARFYTFISTMYYTLEAAAENNVPVIILDRPNPIGGIKVSGNIREEEFKSFVGIAPIPIMHGMTVGELAILFNEQHYLENNLHANLTVIKIKNWKREHLYNQTGLKWINPSPNMINLDAAMVYPGLCLLEGTNISEGRGTQKPFLTFGAPYINSNQLITELIKYKIPGISFSPVEYTPFEIPNMVSNPKYKDQKCNGIELSVNIIDNFDPVKLGIIIIFEIHKLYPDNFEFRSSIERLYGSKFLRNSINENKTPESIFQSWTQELNNFLSVRSKYLLY